MKAKIQGYLGQNHSWAICNREIAANLIELGHEVDLFPTDGVKNLPINLLTKCKTKAHSNYDLQFSYTAMKNWGEYLKCGKRNRFAIWTYEYPILPKGFAQFHAAVNYVLAPSDFSRDIFVNNKVPAEKVITLSHGVNFKEFQTDIRYQLPTNKSIKILMDIGQCHSRKNILGAFISYAKAFNPEDDVCLIAKISRKDKLEFGWEQHPETIMNEFKKLYPKHPEIILITDYIKNIGQLYAACDIVFTQTFSEAFYMPGLQALVADKVVVSPRYGGQLDYLNDNNSYLIDGKSVLAPMQEQYWIGNVNNTHFQCNQDHAIYQLRQAVNEVRNNKAKRNGLSQDELLNKYSWKAITKKMLEMYRE